MKKLEAEEVKKWMAANMKLTCKRRLLTTTDFGRRLKRSKMLAHRLMKPNWQLPFLQRLGRSLSFIVEICNALGITPVELFAKPESLAVLEENGCKTRWEITRAKAALKTKRERALAELKASMGFRPEDC